MNMVLEFLGTGTSTGVPEAGCHCEVCISTNPHDQRLRTSAWIQVGGKSILIDCGPDFRQQAIRAGIERIDALLITHGHYDHAGGLDDLRPYCKDRAFPIYLEPSVASDIRQRIPYCFLENRYPGVPEFRLHEIGLSPFEVEGIPVVPIRAMHYKLPIVGFRIYNLAYITDALYLPEEEYAKLEGVDILVVNALQKKPHISHQTLQDALQMADRLHPRQTYLIHMSHHMGLEETVRKELPESVMLAYDGLRIIL